MVRAIESSGLKWQCPYCQTEWRKTADRWECHDEIAPSYYDPLSQHNTRCRQCIDKAVADDLVIKFAHGTSEAMSWVVALLLGQGDRLPPRLDYTYEVRAYFDQRVKEDKPYISGLVKDYIAYSGFEMRQRWIDWLMTPPGHTKTTCDEVDIWIAT